MTGLSAPGFPCAACGEFRTQATFSIDDLPGDGTYFTRAQLTKDAPRCAACVIHETPTTANFRAPAGWRRCRGSRHRAWDRIWCSGERFTGPGATVCTACHESAELQRANAGRKARLERHAAVPLLHNQSLPPAPHLQAALHRRPPTVLSPYSGPYAARLQRSTRTPLHSLSSRLPKCKIKHVKKKVRRSWTGLIEEDVRSGRLVVRASHEVGTQGDWYFIAEQPAPAPHLAHPEGRAALTHMC